MTRPETLRRLALGALGAVSILASVAGCGGGSIQETTMKDPASYVHKTPVGTAPEMMNVPAPVARRR